MKYMPKVRIPEFDLKDEIVGHYVGNNPFKTHILNSLHVIFPAGEQFFIRTVRYYIEQVQDDDLKKRIKAFIGQEKQHQLKHADLWDVLDKQGLQAKDFAAWYENFAYEGIENWILEKFPNQSREFSLAVTTALEHYTATMAEVFLSDESLFLHETPKGVRKLLRWHAAEEIEHKSVTFDLLKEVGSSRALYIAGFLMATWALLNFTVVGTFYFMMKDRKFSWLDLPGAIAATTPQLVKIAYVAIPKLLDYLDPEFHPDQADNLYLVGKVFTGKKDVLV